MSPQREKYLELVFFQKSKRIKSRKESADPLKEAENILIGTADSIQVMKKTCSIDTTLELTVFKGRSRQRSWRTKSRKRPFQWRET